MLTSSKSDYQDWLLLALSQRWKWEILPTPNKSHPTRPHHGQTAWWWITMVTKAGRTTFYSGLHMWRLWGPSQADIAIIFQATIQRATGGRYGMLWHRIWSPGRWRSPAQPAVLSAKGLWGSGGDWQDAGNPNTGWTGERRKSVYFVLCVFYINMGSLDASSWNMHIQSTLETEELTTLFWK